MRFHYELLALLRLANISKMMPVTSMIIKMTITMIIISRVLKEKKKPQGYSVRFLLLFYFENCLQTVDETCS